MNASQSVSRGFHQLGLLLAATLLTIGVPLMVADAVRLKPWDAGQGDIPVLVVGVLIALVALGLACLAVYGVVRAIAGLLATLPHNPYTIHPNSRALSLASFKALAMNSARVIGPFCSF
jgi:hypothetical protein